MVNMMKSNPQMVRAQYEAVHGVKLSDAQFDAMMAQMNPETVRKGAEMAKNNPEVLRNIQQRQNMRGPEVAPEQP